MSKKADKKLLKLSCKKIANPNNVRLTKFGLIKDRELAIIPFLIAIIKIINPIILEKYLE